MKENEDIKREISLISTLADSLAAIECKTLEEIQDDLRQEDIDLNRSMARLKRFLGLRSIETGEKHAIMVADNGKDLKTEFKNIAEKIAGWSKDKIIGRINELSAAPDVVYSASCGNLENKSIEDLSAILEDIERAIQKRKAGEK